MNRRQLFGWLSALPVISLASKPFYLGLVTAKQTFVSDGSYPRALITFPAPTANWGKIVNFDVDDGFIDMKYRPTLPEWF